MTRDHSGRRGLILTGILFVAATPSIWGRAGSSPEPTVAETPQQSESNPPPQHAVPDDIHIFDPYIGRFRSMQFHDDKTGTPFHYIAEYAWFDRNHSIVQFTISVVNETSGKQATTAQGFYGYDPFQERLHVFGAFTSGRTGYGSVGEFDRENNRRVTWVRSKAADGATIDVRDSAQMQDADTWKSVTKTRKGADGDWKVVYEDTFTRIRE